MRDVFQSFYVDPDPANCIILTGAGDRGFCAGADLKERDGMTDETWKRKHAHHRANDPRHHDLPIPVIAAVNGVAFGGGFEIALACDFIYMSKTARLALPEVTRGIMPGAAGPQNLPRAAGVRRAKEIVLTGLPVSPAAGPRMEHRQPRLRAGQTDDEALETARIIASNAPIGVRQANKTLDKATGSRPWLRLRVRIEAYGAASPPKTASKASAPSTKNANPSLRGSEPACVSPTHGVIPARVAGIHVATQ